MERRERKREGGREGVRGGVKRGKKEERKREGLKGGVRSFRRGITSEEAALRSNLMKEEWQTSKNELISRKTFFCV